MKNLSTLEKNDWVQFHGFTANQRTLYKGRVIQQHWHNYYELEVITRGALKHTLNRDTTDIGRGSVYFLTPIDCHSLVSTEETDIINIAFTDDTVSQNLRQYLNSPIRRSFSPSPEDFNYIEQRALRLIKEHKGNLFSSEIASAIITEVLYLLLRNLSFDEISERSPSLLQSAINIINNQYRQELTINSVARELCVTPQYLGKLFKEQMNISIKDYITNLKLKHACYLLIHTDFPVKEIAFESGYASVEYFLYVFKKNINTTPTAYRRINQPKDK